MRARGAVALEHLVLGQRRGQGDGELDVAAVAAGFVRARLLPIFHLFLGGCGGAAHRLDSV